ncbi:MAG: succinate dehydrogenase assembly factor 2 [Gammaproteobacteria bacterium]|nr:succinate dehydrogenase assembly factor 2 [Gammaproteobacteria bacterium]
MTAEELARLRWQCRRGMLELDAILQPFFEKHFLSLSDVQQHDFEQLLTSSDPALFSWFIGSVTPEDPKLVSIVEVIKHKISVL